MRGSVTKKGTKWYIVVDIGYDDKGKRKQRWFSGFRTKKEAQAKLAEILQQLNTGTYVDTDNITVEQYLNKWLKDYAEYKVRYHTYIGYKEVVNNHIVPLLGNRKLQKLKPTEIQSLYSIKLESDLSSTRVLYIHKILKQALKQAVKWQILNFNPCDSVEPPKKNKSQTETLDESHIEILLDSCKGTQIYLPVFLAITTGMRRGEIAGLRWSDVDIDNKMLYIKNSLQRINGELTFVPTKTDRSRRPIALLDIVAKTLKEYKVQYAKNKLMMGEEYNDLNLVCAWPDGRATSCDYITNEFVKLREKLDIPKVRFHDLRHTHATLLLKMGVNPKIVQERLGHSTISTTMDIYSHALPEMQKEAAEKLENRLFSSKAK